MILECLCDENGADSKLCNKESGQCTCNPHVVGLKCKTCADEYWAFPDCQGSYWKLQTMLPLGFILIFRVKKILFNLSII